MGVLLAATFDRQRQDWWVCYWAELRELQLDSGLVFFWLSLLTGIAYHWFFYWIFMGTCPTRRQAPQHRDPLQGPQRVPRHPQRRVNTWQQSVRAIATWRRATKKIHRILHLRRLWAGLGLSLQTDAIQQLVLGLERKGGILVRRRTPDQEVQRRESAAVAKARARLRARFLDRTASPQ